MSQAKNGRISVGVDIGGTKTAVLAVALPEVRVLFRTTFPTQATLGAGKLRRQLVMTLGRLRSQLHLDERPPVGVSVPELVDLEGLVVTDVVVPGLTGDLKEWADVGVVQVESDVRAAAHAEASAGAGRVFPSFTYISIGTGISSAFVWGGAVWPGAHGAAILVGSGPFGPQLRSDGRPYSLEEVASGPAMAAAYRAVGGRADSAQEVLDQYAYDPLAAKVVARAGSAAGQGVALLVNVLDPHAVIVGGGLGCVDGPYWQVLEAAARTHTWADAARRIPLMRSSLGSDAAAIGAALVASRTQLLVSRRAHVIAAARWQPEIMSFHKGPATILGMQISQSPTQRRPEWFGAGRAQLSRGERRAVQIAAVAVAGFCIYGFAAGSPSTLGYVSSVMVIGTAVVWLRRAALPALLAAGLAIAAVATLAGGLINVGQDVLYNASIGPYIETLGTHFVQYDHLVHAFVSFVVAFACWFMLAAPHAGADHRRELVLLAVAAALGFGALNEMVEFLATLAHHGAHAGGYWNTGWDLVCNFIGAGGAGLVIARSRAGAA